MSNPREDKATERPVWHDEARKIAQRLINGSFRRDGESLEVGKRPQFSIPANRDRDDDLRIIARRRPGTQDRWPRRRQDSSIAR